MTCSISCFRCGADLDPDLPGARCGRCFPAPAREPDAATSTNLGRVALVFSTKRATPAELRELAKALRRGAS